MTDEPATAGPLAGRTAWARSLETPLRAFLRTETGGAAVLLGAAVAALAWVNGSTPPGSATTWPSAPGRPGSPRTSTPPT